MPRELPVITPRSSVISRRERFTERCSQPSPPDRISAMGGEAGRERAARGRGVGRHRTSRALARVRRRGSTRPSAARHCPASWSLGRRTARPRPRRRAACGDGNPTSRSAVSRSDARRGPASGPRLGAPKKTREASSHRRAGSSWLGDDPRADAEPVEPLIERAPLAERMIEAALQLPAARARRRTTSTDCSAGSASSFSTTRSGTTSTMRRRGKRGRWRGATAHTVGTFVCARATVSPERSSWELCPGIKTPA